MNVMCLGTQQRQIAEGDPSHGFHQVTMARLHCRSRLHGWTSVFAGMTWAGSFFLCSTAQSLIATRHRDCLSSVIAVVATTRVLP
jgi:hypothetical protein